MNERVTNSTDPWEARRILGADPLTPEEAEWRKRGALKWTATCYPHNESKAGLTADEALDWLHVEHHECARVGMVGE